MDAILEGGVRLRALLKAQDASAFAAIRQAVEAGMEEFRSEHTYKVPMPAVVAAGKKP
jgi:hypothetical protein